MKPSTGSAGQAVEQAAGGEGKDAAVSAVEEKTGEAVPLTEEELKKKAEEEAAKAAAEAGKAVEKPAGGSG